MTKIKKRLAKKNKYGYFYKTVISLIVIFSILTFIMFIINRNVNFLDNDIEKADNSKNVFNISEVNIEYNINKPIKLNKYYIDDKVLNKMQSYNFDCNMLLSNDETDFSNYTGVKLTDILDYYGISKFNEISFIASDDYRITLSRTDIDDNVFISYIENHQFMDGKYYNKLILPNELSEKWIHNIERIKIT